MTTDTIDIVEETIGMIVGASSLRNHMETHDRANYEESFSLGYNDRENFINDFVKILRNSNLPFFYKIELLLMGLRYAKYILLIIITILDVAVLFEKGIDNIINDNIYKK